MPDPSQDFGARLALVRQQAGWTNIRLAAIVCNLDAGSWRAWETQHRMPRNIVEVCEKVADRSGCSLIWLMTGRGEPGGSIGPSARSSTDRASDYGSAVGVLHPPPFLGKVA